MSAEYRFRFSEDHLLTSFARYRQQVWWRRPFQGVKWVLALLLGVFAVVCVVNGLGSLAGIFGGLVVLLVAGGPIDAWLIRTRFENRHFTTMNCRSGSQTKMFMRLGNTMRFALDGRLSLKHDVSKMVSFSFRGRKYSIGFLTLRPIQRVFRLRNNWYARMLTTMLTYSM